MAGAQTRVIPAPLLVFGGVLSVQFGSALAATLVPEIGAGGAVFLRLVFSAVILAVVARPRLRGYSTRDWATVIAFGLALGSMNWSFYGSLAHLPIGVAVTVEFCGPLLLAALLSRRRHDFLAVLAAAGGVVLTSNAFVAPATDLSWVGLGLAGLAGVFWAAYILLSARTGAIFEGLDGLAIALVVATLLVTPVGLASADLWTTEHLTKGVGLALLSSLIPYSLELLALRRLSAKVFGILLSTEPAVAAMAGLIVLGQRLSLLQLLGLLLVVTASVIVLGGGEAQETKPSDAGEIEGA
jgi:inner membrane transporter RhtA